MLKTLHGRHWIKYGVALAVCLSLRLIPWRVPNVEPILATTMPFSEQLGPVAGFLFAVLSIVLYDTLTHGLSVWTVIIAGTYGAVAMLGWVFLRKNRGRVWGYFLYSIVGTLFFDAVTGLGIGPLFFGQPFREALLGQIPFTMYHLMGNMFLSLTLSPAVYQWIVVNKKLEPQWLWRSNAHNAHP